MKKKRTWIIVAGLIVFTALLTFIFLLQPKIAEIRFIQSISTESTNSSGWFSRTRKSNHTDVSNVDYYHDYQETGGQIGFVTGVSKIDDGDYNQTVYEGIETYAQAAGVSYSYYIAKRNTKEAYRDAIDEALTNNSRLIVCAGDHFNQIIGEYQFQYPQVSFLMIDGNPEDASGIPIHLADNVYCIQFHEEEAGYLAGYFAVLEGYTSFGFIGGESVSEVKKYGYGFLQGIDAAARDLNIQDQISVKYWYAETFLPHRSITRRAKNWYASGTQVIFACGGAIYESVLKAAEAKNKWMIGVDVNQNDYSDNILTSAMKGIDIAVIQALDEYFVSNAWTDEMKGQIVTYGADSYCTGLPTDPWRFYNVNVAQYDTYYGRLRSGEINISSATDAMPALDISIVTY